MMETIQTWMIPCKKCDINYSYDNLFVFYNNVSIVVKRRA